MGWVENHPFKSSLIASLIVFTFGALIHYQTYMTPDWGSFLLWIPIYLSPIWGISTASWYSEKKKGVLD